MNYVEGKRLRLDSEGNSSEAGYTGSIAFANSTYYLPYLAHAASLSYPMLSRPRSKPTTLARKSNFYSRATRSPLRNHPVEGQVASVAEVSINADVDSKMTASQALQFASLALPSPSFSLVNISSHGTPNDHLPAHTALSSDNLTNTDSDHSISNNPASKINIKLNSSQNTVTTRPEDFRRTEVAATATAAAEAAAAVAASSTSGSGPKRTTFEQLELADLAEQVLPAGPRLEDQDCRELERRLMELLEEDEELTRKKQILTELALREAEVARKRQELHRLERNLKSARRLKQDDLATESSTSRQNKRDNPNPGLHEMAGKQMCQRTGQPGPAPVREHLSNRTDKINQEVKSTRDLTDESSSRKEKADCDDRLRGMKSQQHNQPGSVGSPESQLCNNPVDSSLEGENELLILSIANSDTESLEEKQSVSNTNTDTTSSDALSPISAARNSDKPRSEASSILMHSRSLRTRQNGLPLLSLRVAGSSVGLASGALAHYSRPPALMSLHLPVASRHPRPATSLIVTPPIQPTQHSPVDRPPVSISYYVPPEAKRPVPGPRNLIDTLSYNRELFTGPKTEPTTSIPMPGRHTSLLGPPKLP
ncbi:unnamed protein product [Protopolystoma xenopodis]|uniref:Uncharacterized protein n=1 Tax=Protopolystoma xenopodis TaxID=117903 RepID=A0A3S4ZPW9_9PLAT|nr:unnamed protein product [Protopolystoma xenopodis]